MSIRRLPPSLVNQIAAGEVVERPASVVKELLENALDAGATRISVAIAGGGIESIEVADDGCGIAAAELPLAVAAHATSKIGEAADLERISTLGFRGEALASIASVSECSIRSRRREDAAAASLAAHGGAIGEVRPDAGPAGTLVSIRHLFLNTPARRKFLKSPVAETSRIAELVRTMALARPDVAFRFEIDGKVALECPATASPEVRLAAVLGEEVAASLIALEPVEGVVRVWGFVGRPAQAKGSSRSQRLYLNGRAIHDRLILHAVREGYRGLMPGDRHPVVALFIEIDPAEVDVNVHPAKTEVRFRSPEAVHAAVRRGVKAALASVDLTPSIEVESAERAASLAGGRAAPRRDPEAPWRLRSGGGGSGPGLFAGAARSGGGPKGFDFAALATRLATDATEPASSIVASAVEGLEASRSVIQVGGAFLISEDDEGLVVVDQHALHERLSFESLRERITAGPLESQRLLVPVVRSVPEATVEAIEEAAPLLRRLGFEVELAGDRRLALLAAPTLLASRGVDAADFVVELLGRWIEEGPIPDEAAALEPVLAMMACKASVRAGDRLSAAEMSGLFARALEVERASNCPHGRPTTLRISWSDLRRRFGRSS